MNEPFPERGTVPDEAWATQYGRRARTALAVIRVWVDENTKGTLAEILVTVTGDVPAVPHDNEDWHTGNLAGESHRSAMWQIYDPVGDVSTVHETEAEFVWELMESLRTSPTNIELRVSRLPG